jgi:hypothetical protein
MATLIENKKAFRKERKQNEELRSVWVKAVKKVIADGEGYAKKPMCAKKAITLIDERVACSYLYYGKNRKKNRLIDFYSDTAKGGLRPMLKSQRKF